MNEVTIVCPSCKTDIPLTESLAAPLIEATRKKFELQIAQKETGFAKREADLHTQEDEIRKEKENVENLVATRLESERNKLVAEEARKARLLVSGDLEQKAKEVSDLKEVLHDRDAKLAKAQNAEAEFLRKQRELDDARREMELKIENRVQESLGPIRDKAKQEAEEGLGLKVREKEEQIASMQRQIEDLKRKADQGSQQLQGEVQELQLEELLRSNFARDLIQPVAKGEFGGDVLQRVTGPSGQDCGAILWEVKRTRNWSDGWLAKLRGDQRAAKAEIALIVSQVLPKGVDSFNLVEGVWVTNPRCAVPVAIALRESLIGVFAARKADEGRLSKVEVVYQYLTGPRFRQRVEAIVETFSDMHADLARERKAMTKLWGKREEQIRGVIEATAGMYGDLQGIAGKSLKEIDGLDFQLLGAPSDIKAAE
jgi:hypothetical protein